MKQLIKLSLLALVLFTVTIQAQIEVDSAIATANYSRALGAYSLNSGRYEQDPFQVYQSFGFYNNPEIQKLEDEVENMAHVYRYENNGKSAFSSDKYSSLSADEKKSIKNMFGFYGLAAFSYSGRNSGSKNSEKEKSTDTRMEEFFNKFVVPYLEKDKSINRQRILDEIKKKLNTLFEMKEAEKQKDVEKLQKQLQSLQSTLSERKKNKPQIIDQRLNELIGLPSTLRW